MIPIELLHIIDDYLGIYELIDWIDKSKLKVSGLAQNPKAVHYLIENNLFAECLPYHISANPGAIHILTTTHKKLIRFNQLARNPTTKAIEYIIENMNSVAKQLSEIDLFILLSGNPAFTIEHASKLNMYECVFAIDPNTREPIFPDIIYSAIKCANPLITKFLKNYIELYGTDILSDEEWNILACHCKDSDFIIKYYDKFNKSYLSRNHFAFDILKQNGYEFNNILSLANNNHPEAIKILNKRIIDKPEYVSHRLIRILASNTGAMPILKKILSDSKWDLNMIFWTALSKNESIFKHTSTIQILSDLFQ